MAEQTINSVATAVAGELTNRAFSGLVETFGKQAAAGEKLQRLEMLLIKIHSAVEASEKHAVENSWLVQWRDKLKEAASQGDEVLAVFMQRATNDQSMNKNTTNDQQQAGASSQSSTAGPLSFARNHLSGVVQSIRDATKKLFSSNKEMEKLNGAVERLEKLSLNIGEFIRLLQLEISPKLEQSRAPKRKRPQRSSTLTSRQPTDSMVMMRKTRRAEPADDEEIEDWSALELAEAESDEFLFQSVLEPEEDEEFEFQEWSALLHKLTEALGEIRWATEAAEERALEGSGRLAQWAAVLQEAVQRGQAAHTAYLLRGCNELEQEHGHLTVEQMFGLVRRLEMLAGEVDPFVSLVELCPLARTAGENGPAGSGLDSPDPLEQSAQALAAMKWTAR